MKRTSLALALGGTLAAAVFTATVAVPAAADWFEKRHDEYGSYRTGAEAKKDRASVPRWLPDDAAKVEYAMKTTGGERALMATLSSPALPAGCTPMPTGADRPAPALTPSWFPKDARDKATARCGLYYTYVDGHTLYAWQDNDDWIKQNKSGSPH
ncbi:hypothetical protein [Streptomyces sp. NPDC090025]|uniref:hypothetical protein n=1 Tax=Streptomyces sp. NPDC090025 TaxID=3365922 RepID=UPI0038358F10